MVSIVTVPNYDRLDQGAVRRQVTVSFPGPALRRFIIVVLSLALVVTMIQAGTALSQATGHTQVR